MGVIARVYRELHARHLERHAARLAHRLLHTVAAHVALHELVLAQLTDLEDEVPLAVDPLDDRLVGEDQRARTGLARKRKTRLRWHDSAGCKQYRCRRSSSGSPASSLHTKERTLWDDHLCIKWPAETNRS